jgi:hypothetical protein
MHSNNSILWYKIARLNLVWNCPAMQVRHGNSLFQCRKDDSRAYPTYNVSTNDS